MIRMKVVLFCGFFFGGLIPAFAQVGLGVETPSASAKLELSSTDLGFLMPRMTQTQRNAISSPSTGLMVFQTDNSSGFYYYTGSAWVGPLTPSEVDGLVKTNGQSIFTGNLNLASKKLTNVKDPTNATDLATKSYVDGLSGGLLWREPVINLVSSAPNSPSDGDRYILSSSWGGGSQNQIATYNSGSWSFVSPSSKDAVFASVPSNGYVFNGTQWSEFSSGTVYTFTGGLSNTNNTVTLSNGGVLNNHLANSSVTAAKLNAMSASSGQLLTYNGSNWAATSSSIGTVTTVSGGSGISVSNGSTTPTVSISKLTLAMGGTNSINGSITGSTALNMAAGGSNSNITLSPSGNGYTLLNGKVGMGITSPTTLLHIQNANAYSGSPSSNDAPTVNLYNSSNNSSTAHSLFTIRTGGNSGGDPYASIDIAAVRGYSMGIENSSDRFIINSKWNFINGSGANKLVQFIESGQSRVLICDANANIKTNWPSGWGGGLCTWDLSVSSIYYTSMSSMSDKRLKNTITDLGSNFSAKYMRLNPVTYYWNSDVFPVHQLNYGFISQEVEEIFPELVATATDEIQTKSVNYQSLTSMHVEMLQKHQSELDVLKAQNDKQEAEIEELRKLILRK
jgi:hypothetical protein